MAFYGQSFMGIALGTHHCINIKGLLVRRVFALESTRAQQHLCDLNGGVENLATHVCPLQFGPKQQLVCVHEWGEFEFFLDYRLINEEKCH
jgi:hypothetical protein